MIVVAVATLCVCLWVCAPFERDGLFRFISLKLLYDHFYFSVSSCTKKPRATAVGLSSVSISRGLHVHSRVVASVRLRCFFKHCHFTYELQMTGHTHAHTGTQSETQSARDSYLFNGAHLSFNERCSPNFAVVITLNFLLSFCSSAFSHLCLPHPLFFFLLFLYHLFVQLFILIIAEFSSFLSYNLLIFFCGFFDCTIKTVNSAIFLLTVWPQCCHLRRKWKLQFTTGRISSECLSLTRSHLKIYFEVLELEIGKLYTASYPGFFFFIFLLGQLSFPQQSQ